MTNEETNDSGQQNMQTLNSSVQPGDDDITVHVMYCTVAAWNRNQIYWKYLVTFAFGEGYIHNHLQ